MLEPEQGRGQEHHEGLLVVGPNAVRKGQGQELQHPGEGASLPLTDKGARQPREEHQRERLVEQVHGKGRL
jgi:hypothetical protein